MHRWLIVTATVAAALSAAPAASAIYKPILIADPTLTKPGAAGDLTIGFVASNRGSQQPITDDPTARVVVAVPAGYAVVRTNRQFGSRIGSVNAKYEIEQGGTRTTAYLNGAVTLESPAAYRQNDCAAGDHDAVFVARFTVAGEQLSVSLYFDTGGTVNGATVAARIEFCFDPPEGRALLRGRFFTFVTTLKGIIANPSQAGTYIWRGFFTPYDQGWQQPVPSGVVEARRISGLPVTVTIHARRSRGSVVVSGSVTRAGEPVAGAEVKLFVGSRPSALRPSGPKTTTDRTGRFRFVIKAAATTFVRVRAANIYEKAGSCSGASTAEAGCVFSGPAYFIVFSSIARAPR